MAKTAYDWEVIEREYRAGQLSDSELSRQYGPSRAAIKKHMAARNIQRDLTDQIRSATRAKVAAQTEVTGQVTDATSRATDAKIVEKAADRAAGVTLGHLSTARRLKRLLHANMTLLELHVGLEPDRTSFPGDALAAALDPTKAVPGNLFVGKSDGVANMLRAVTDTAERVQRLERQALNMDDAPPPAEGDFVSVLTKARERAARAASQAPATTPAHGQ